MAPVPLGREVEDPARADQGAVGRHKYPSYTHLTARAGFLVSLGAFREGLTEHESNPLAHDTNLVDGVHERLNRRIEHVAVCVANHQKYQSGLVATFSGTFRRSISASSAAFWSGP